jgi:hypothetical protein
MPCRNVRLRLTRTANLLPLHNSSFLIPTFREGPQPDEVARNYRFLQLLKFWSLFGVKNADTAHKLPIILVIHVE